MTLRSISSHSDGTTLKTICSEQAFVFVSHAINVTALNSERQRTGAGQKEAPAFTPRPGSCRSNVVAPTSPADPSSTEGSVSDQRVAARLSDSVHSKNETCRNVASGTFVPSARRLWLDTLRAPSLGLFCSTQTRCSKSRTASSMRSTAAGIFVFSIPADLSLRLNSWSLPSCSQVSAISRKAAQCSDPALSFASLRHSSARSL